ncbi:MAG TPA: YfcE family phosphodiesterase [Bryobacteraceae bacterium]|nr:YfcE family phosphodiesterase [Bryobacteraceae bacterium]
MRLAVVSDIHANWEALSSLPGGYDELWVLGDLVNYGPNPVEVVEFIRANAAVVVQGNHDHSVGFGVEPQCSPRYRDMARETGLFTAAALSEGQKAYLRRLPTCVEREVVGCQFFLCHAAPSNPLFSYRGPDSPEWVSEVERLGADVLLVGHTHLPFIQSVGRCQVVNPGSVGQPKNGSPRACYAVWEDGIVQVQSFEYPVNITIEKLRSLPLSNQVRQDLAAMLRTGCTPQDRDVS